MAKKYTSYCFGVSLHCSWLLVGSDCNWIQYCDYPLPPLWIIVHCLHPIANFNMSIICIVIIKVFYRRQIISIEWATTPHSFNSISCAGANLGVLATKISVLRLKLVIICATRAGANLGVLEAKISVWRPKLVIICVTRAGANLGAFAAKISVLRPKLVIFCATRAGANLGVLVFKIWVLRQKLVIICASSAEAKLCVLAYKISVLYQKLVIIWTVRCGSKIRCFSL